MWIVYQHTNLKNGKSYVGCTSKTLNQRWSAHVKSAHDGSPRIFHKAIRKYGVDCWDSKVLCECEVKEDAFRREIEFIEIMKTFFIDHPETGYNMTRGGEGPNGIKYSHTSEAKRKISKALRERVVSDETRKKISESRMGIVFSEETKEKMSESQTGKVLSEETRRKMSENRRGKTKSEECKQKIGDANRGRVHNEESRKNMSDSRRGIKQSQETKDKRAQSLKDYHRRKAEESARLQAYIDEIDGKI